MLTELHKEMLRKPPSAPMSNYVFGVKFYYDDYDMKGNRIQPDMNGLSYDLNNDTDRSMIAIRVDLPTFDTQLVQKHFLGTEKSFPILRKYGGDTTLEFYTHTDPHENNFIVYNFFKRFADKTQLQQQNKFYHKEFITVFNQIEISVGDRPDGNEVYLYYLNNCIVTKIDTGSLTYEGQEALKYSMTVHYDDWSIAEKDVTENEQRGKGTR